MFVGRLILKIIGLIKKKVYDGCYIKEKGTVEGRGGGMGELVEGRITTSINQLTTTFLGSGRERSMVEYCFHTALVQF